jgi:hypothetical protein
VVAEAVMKAGTRIPGLALMPLSRVLSALLGISFCLPVAACECSFGPLSQHEVDAAEQVFVFQLVAAEHVASDSRPGEHVAAKIRVVDTLLGSNAPTRMRYSTFWCCGSNLDVGHYYAAFLPGEVSDSFFAHAGNLLPLGEFLLEAQLDRLQRVVARTGRLDACFGEWPSRWMEMSPPPPPPVPPQAESKAPEDRGSC